MFFYDLFMSPLEFLFFKKLRKEVMIKAKGNVLEIGFGSGANYKYFDLNKISKIVAVDVYDNKNNFPQVEFIHTAAEKLPFDDGVFDTVVSGLAMCSVDDLDAVLLEIQRVLKPNGEFLFMEHQRPTGRMGNIFDRVNKIWSKNEMGCNINKQILKKIEETPMEVSSNIKYGVMCYGSAKKMQ